MAVPTITSVEITRVALTTAVATGIITSIGGHLATVRGFCWNLTGSPTVADNVVSESGSFTKGYFEMELTGLSRGVKCHVRAFALNSDGYGYGDEIHYNVENLIVEMAFNQAIFTDPALATWTDISVDVRQVHGKLGRNHELGRNEAGTAVVVLDNASGNYWRHNSSSPYYPYVKPLTLIRIKGKFDGVTSGLFYGLMESIKPGWLSEKGHKNPIMTIEVVDFFKALARTPIYGTLVGDLTHPNTFADGLSEVRVDAFFDEMEIPYALRNVGDGKVWIQELAAGAVAGGVNALEHLQAVTEAECGNFFQAGDGKLTYQGRDARFVSPLNTSQATFSDYDPADAFNPYIQPKIVDDDMYIYNVCAIKGYGTEQIYYDAAKVLIDGWRELKRIPSLIYMDGDAYAQCFMLVNRYKDTDQRIESLVIYPASSPAKLFPKVFGYGISTKITFKLGFYNPAGIDRDYHIEGITFDWKASTGWVFEWQLGETNPYRIIEAEHDGILTSESNAYTTAHDAANATQPPPFDDIGSAAGQSHSGNFISGFFSLSRGFLEFDTSIIGIAETVESATLLLHVSTVCIIDRALYVVVVDPNGVEHPLAASDYSVLHGSSSSMGTSALIPTPSIANTWIVIHLTAGGLALINKGGTTRFGLRSSHEKNTSAPTGSERVVFDGVSTDNRPQLIVKVA